MIRKNFFDLWDNLFKLALINLGFIISLAFPVFIPSFFESIPVLEVGALLIGSLWCFVYLAAAAFSLRNISDYGSFGFADFFGNLKTAWPVGLVLGLFAFLGFILCSMVIPFYFGMESILGLLLAGFIFWTLVTAALALQFFFAVRFRLNTKITGAIKKCFIIFFDNPMFCVFSFIHNMLVLALSLFTVFLLPGLAGILLFLDEGLRLRLLKYDWLEANPEADRRNIPWDALLVDEREKTGTRSFKSFIFPWKD